MRWNYADTINCEYCFRLACRLGAENGRGVKFQRYFQRSLNNAKETEAADQAGTLALLAGEDNGIHATMIESQKAELALNLAIQIRNKVVDAYNEVMRMQL